MNSEGKKLPTPLLDNGSIWVNAGYGYVSDSEDGGMNVVYADKDIRCILIEDSTKAYVSIYLEDAEKIIESIRMAQKSLQDYVLMKKKGFT